MEKLIIKAVAGIKIEDLEFVAVCIPGIRHYAGEIKIVSELLKSGKAEVSGDEVSAFYGSLALDYGIVILSGTGSFAMGVNRQGEELSVGGWGPLVGDEGSGYQMGIMAIKAAIAEYEHRGPETLLMPMVLEHFGIDHINMLKKELYKEGLNTKRIASLSKSVLRGAELKDNVALAIINESSVHLYKLAELIIKKLEMTDDHYKLCLTGGISNFGKYILNPLTAMLHENYDNITVSEPIFTPGVGSLLSAFKKGGLKIDTILINNLKASYKGVDRKC